MAKILKNVDVWHRCDYPTFNPNPPLDGKFRIVLRYLSEFVKNSARDLDAKAGNKCPK
jgi:hypothetical protein